MHIGFAAVLAVLFLVGIVSYRSVIASAETQRWVQHTQEVLEHLDNLLLEINITDNGYHEFALSGEEVFLQSSVADRSLVDQEVEGLRALTADNPRQQLNLSTLSSLLQQVNGQDENLIRLRLDRADSWSFCLREAIRQGQSDRLLGQIRGVIRDMEDAEERLLLMRNAEAARRFRNIKAAILLGSFLGLLIAVVAGVAVQRDYAARGYAEAKYRGLFGSSAGCNGGGGE